MNGFILLKSSSGSVMTWMPSLGSLSRELVIRGLVRVLLCMNAICGFAKLELRRYSIEKAFQAVPLNKDICSMHETS